MESNNEQDWYTKGELYFEPTPPSDIMKKKYIDRNVHAA